MTPDALAVFGFRVILLRGKHPVSRDGHHWVTTDPAEIQAHRGNVGLMAGRHAALDFDLVGALAEMSIALGPLRQTVETGSGKVHCYVEAVAGLPRYFFWRGAKVGEIARLETEYTVIPPSIHPDTHRPYRWLVDPRDPLPGLPDAWRAYLLDKPDYRPDYIPEGNAGVPAPEPWDGPPADELVRRALLQPGARQRSNGVKFQCPGCRDEGHDRHRDNAAVFADGRWGCAVNSEHRRAIGEALGVIASLPPALTPLRGVRGLRGVR